MEIILKTTVCYYTVNPSVKRWIKKKRKITLILQFVTMDLFCRECMCVQSDLDLHYLLLCALHKENQYKDLPFQSQIIQESNYTCNPNIHTTWTCLRFRSLIKIYYLTNKSRNQTKSMVHVHLPFLRMLLVVSSRIF